MRDVWRAARRLLRRFEIRRRRVRLLSRPAVVNIELTGRCNVKPACTFCVGKNLPTYHEPGHLSEEQLASFWPWLSGAERVNDCSYGEPLARPDFLPILDRLRAAGVFVGFTSNGLLLNEQKARFLVERGETLDLCISLNAATRETYWAHHGQDWEKLLANVRGLVAAHDRARPGQPVPLMLSFIVMQSNRHEVVPFLRLASDLGARVALLRHLFDIGIRGFTANNFGHHFDYDAETLPFAEYQAIEAEVRAMPELRAPRAGREPLAIAFAWNGRDSFIAEQAEPGVDVPCLFPWKFLSIRPLHGFVAPCVYLKRGVATPQETTVAQIWNGQVMTGLRRELKHGRVPAFCMEHGNCCPLVLEQRAAAGAPVAVP
jgi:MoaA/NifB/PqqE/SkfB family radical SAM enzyme